MNPRFPKKWRWVCGVVAFLGIAFWAIQAEAYYHAYFVSSTTGSNYGYTHTRWFGSFNRQSRVSPLETYLTAHGYPVKNRWCRPSDTGYAFYGQAISFSCGRMPPIHRLDHRVQRLWLEHATEKEVVAFYKLAGTGTDAQVEAACNAIIKRYDPGSFWVN
ncbi:MAG: hypothetical protein ABL949_05355 [Fimbriimonadaceae bacterium]